MSTKTNCCVAGCPRTCRILHKFPRPDKTRAWKTVVFQIWLYRACNEIADNEERILEINQNYRICGDHFSESCKLPPYNKLKRGSLPTLHLPNFTEEPNEINCQFVELQRYPDSKEMQMFGSYQPRMNETSPTNEMDGTNSIFEIDLTLSGDDINEINETDSNSEQLKLKIFNLKKKLENKLQTTKYVPPILEEIPEIPELPQPETLPLPKPHFKSIKVYLTEDKCLSEVCRICFCTIGSNNMIKLYKDPEDSQEDPEKIKDILKEVLPDLDLGIYEHSVICKKCKDLLISSYELKQAWLATEKKLQKIIENEIKSQNKTNSSLVLVAKTAKTKTKPKPTIQFDHDYTNKISSPLIKTYSSKKKTEENLNTNYSREIVQENPTTSSSMKNSEDDSILFEYLNFKNQMKQPQETQPLEEIQTFQAPEPLKNHNIFAGIRRRSNLMGNGPFLCEECGKVLKEKTSLKKHMLGHKLKLQKQNEQPTQSMCEACGELFDSIRELRKHAQRKHKKKPKEPQQIIRYQCEYCDKILFNKHSLQTHIRHIHLNLYNYVQCHLCGKQLTSRSALTAHIRIVHTAQKRYSCEICDKRFFWLPSLRKHLLRHSDSRVACEVCGKTVKYESTLRRHIKIFHMNEGKTNCEYCGKPYWKKYDLVRHKIRIHGWTPDLERVTEQG